SHSLHIATSGSGAREGHRFKNYVLEFVKEKPSSRPPSFFSWKPVRDEQMDGPNCKVDYD
ncbi:MAG: hypothetical protein WBA17_05175, partial [Saprospiraceae bacterium]